MPIHALSHSVGGHTNIALFAIETSKFVYYIALLRVWYLVLNCRIQVFDRVSVLGGYIDMRVAATDYLCDGWGETRDERKGSVHCM